jgi:hypothetical protein
MKTSVHGISSAGFARNPLVQAGTQEHRRQKNGSKKEFRSAIHFSVTHILDAPAPPSVEIKLKISAAQQ